VVAAIAWGVVGALCSANIDPFDRYVFGGKTTKNSKNTNLRNDERCFENAAK